MSPDQSDDRRWLADSTGAIILGPFESEDLALKVRVYVEQVRGREDVWILNDVDVRRAKERSS